VREHYDIAPGGVLIGRGGLTRWYAPMAHPELPQFIAALRHADDRGLVAFAEEYGALGFTSLTADANAAMYTWPDGTTTTGGDPLDWMRAHGRTVQLCLELTEALQRNDAAAIDRLTGCSSLVDMSLTLPTQPGAVFALLSVAQLATVHQLSVHLNVLPFDRARVMRANIINPNIERVSRRLTVLANGANQSFWRYSSMIEAVYWHLANAAEGGSVIRCKRPGCGALFIQRHRRQEYCAPRFRQRESPCAFSMRNHRRPSALQRIATEVETGRAKTPQVRVGRNKNARQSPRGKSGR
jgi:hypothetical protein